jgi:TolB-like protein/DNA-binding winged helix-turn-helix (wHTH) protein/Tfp pilus assembly protein PilF
LATHIKSPEDRVSFSEFEFDCGTRELKKNGQTLRLEPQPAKILAILIRNAGEIVTRQELMQEVWGSETFVDFDQGLNYAIRRIRAALDDDAEAPRFLETLPKTGYRFIAQVARSKPYIGASIAPTPPSPARTRSKLNHLTIAALVLVPLLILFAIIAWRYRHREPADGSGARFTFLAVLPLRNLSADPEQEYFSEGMTDELITNLARMTGIRVISHTSVERYKNTTAPLPQIARELGVDGVVEGTVTRAGNRVRVTAQLIDAHNDTHIWADSYERDMTDTLAIQDSIARDIAARILGTVLPVREVHELPPRNVPPAALDSYLRGRYLWNQRDPQSIVKARQYFEDAVRQAPDFAPAYSGLADSYWVGWGTDMDLALAEKYARKALSLDPELAEAHASLGVTLLVERRIREAQPELLRAIDLNPNYAMAHHYYSSYLLTRGLPEDALAENDRARQLDPFGVAVNSMRTLILISSHRFNEALVQAANLAELAPQNPVGYGYLARVYRLLGRVPESLEAEKKVGIAKHQDEWVRDQAELEEIYKHEGLQPTLLRAPQLMEKHKDPVGAAFVYGNLRDSERVLQLLRANWDNANVALEIKSAPEFDFLRHNPLFQEIEHRVHPDL